jgi:hypothetical protein
MIFVTLSLITPTPVTLKHEWPAYCTGVYGSHAAIENELMIERQVKQDLQGRLASLQTTTASLIAAFPGIVVT